MGPADLISPKDVAVDGDGNAVVAHGSEMVKVFSPTGELLSSVPFHRPQHVATMANGNLLVSGFPRSFSFTSLTIMPNSLRPWGRR
jgi:hypothetical protein